MLRGNLSSRPFYNDRLVTVAIALAAVIVAAATVFTVSRLYSLSAERSTVRTQIEAEVREATRIRSEAAALQQRIDRDTLTRLTASTHEANALIDQRTFSWTRLLAQLEETLPPGVRLTSIAPRPDRGEFRIAMAVVARDLDDLDAFVEALIAAGGFYDVAPVEQRADEGGTYQAVVQASYLSSRGQATPEAAVRP